MHRACLLFPFAASGVDESRQERCDLGELAHITRADANPLQCSPWADDPLPIKTPEY